MYITLKAVMDISVVFNLVDLTIVVMIVGEVRH